MALPPEKVVLRRKRGEETVEVLLLQRQKRLRIDFQYHLDLNESIQQTSHTPSRSILDFPRVPTVRVTQPHEDHINPNRNRQLNDRDAQHGSQTRPPSLFQDGPVKNQNGLQATISKPEPRAFYLTARAPSVSVQPSRLHNGIQKRKKKHRSDLAVFIERRAKAADSMATHETNLDSDMVDPNEPRSYHDFTESGDAVPRKRPGATEEELRWRVKNWNKAKDPSETTDTNVAHSRISTARSTHTEENSMKLAEELHYLAMLETYGGKDSLGSSGASPNRTGLKFQPKPPPQRHSGKEGNTVQSGEIVSAEAHAARENGSDDDSGEWCYHTYTRRPNPSQTASSSDGTAYVDPLQSLDMERVGLLVIKPEDEEMWDSYVGDDEGDSDKDWNSEEEDENAEDFYGNDYPEDEVDSEDEYGRGAYKHRHGASDDEEYDNDNGSWSDEEVEEPKLWKARP